MNPNIEDIVFKRTSKGAHNITSSEEQLANNDNSLDKAGMGDINLNNIESSYKTMPLDKHKT